MTKTSESKEALQEMGQEKIVSMIQLNLNEITRLRGQIALASEVLIESHGIDIDAVLETENTNGENTIT